jgi:hypothetical protein
MPYADIEQSENLAKQSYLYLIQLSDRTLTYCNGPATITATINGTEYSFVHPLGGIWHGSEGASVDEEERKEDPGPTESPDAARSGIDIHVSDRNPIIRAHRSFPPPGDTEVSIYRQNEIDGTPEPIHLGYVIVETPIEGSTGIIRCHHIAELVAGSEGLNESFGPTCPFMHTQFPCPVPIASATDSNLVVEDIDIDNFTVTLSGSIRLAGKYKLGVLIAPDDDKRMVLDDSLDGSDHVLTIQQNFPSTTLRVGDVVSVIRGCDRLHGTCANEWGGFTGNGAAFGGNNLQANKNPHQVGRIQ